MSEDRLEQSLNMQPQRFGMASTMFRTRIFRVSELIDMLKERKLRLVGDKPFKKWSISHKSRVIECLLLGLPADSIIIDGSESVWYLVDGAELISTIYEYVTNSFSLKNVNFDISEYANASFDALPLHLRGRLYNLEIIGTIINPDTSPIHKLGIYGSSLLKIGKEKELWRCTQAVYPDSFRKIQAFAYSLDIEDSHLLWQIMVAVLFAQRFRTGKFELNVNLSGTRFDMLECIMLERFEVAYEFFSHDKSISRDALPVMAHDIQEVLNEQEEWTYKKKTIFTIVTSLLYPSVDKFDKEAFLKRFERAWKKNSRIGVGHLFRDYAVKSSAIFKSIVR